MKQKQAYLSKATRYLVGKSVPKQHNGNVGRLVEAMMSGIGYKLNNGAGPDIPKIKTDIKTRTVDSTSPYSIGSATIEAIKNERYEDSTICEKFQYHYRVRHDNKKIISAELYDFTNDFIQEKVKHAYETGRASIKKGCTDSYICGKDAWGYFEKKDSNSYIFRVPSAKMEVLEHMSTSKFKDLFE